MAIERAETTNFTLVSDMNRAFGNPPGDPYYPNWERLASQAKALRKEVQEIDDAIAARDLTALRDACSDVGVFTYGMHHLMGINADMDMASVVEAVYTRFCKDQDQLDRTRAHYDAMSIEYYVMGEFPFVCLKSAYDQGEGDGGFEYAKDKFLKCVDFHEPLLLPLEKVEIG